MPTPDRSPQVSYYRFREIARPDSTEYTTAFLQKLLGFADSRKAAQVTHLQRFLRSSTPNRFRSQFLLIQLKI